jgi:hypothetical protein
MTNAIIEWATEVSYDEGMPQMKKIKILLKKSIKPLQISYPCFISPTVIAFAVDPSVNWLLN